MDGVCGLSVPFLSPNFGNSQGGTLETVLEMTER